MHPLSRRIVLLLVLCVAQMAPASAQDDERLVRGRASYSPAMTQALLTKIETFCADADKSARAPLAMALAGWHQRHAALLAENARVRAELVTEAGAPTAPPELKAELDNMFRVRVPEKVDSDFKKMFPPASSKGWASKAFSCGVQASLLDEGKYDLARTDPAVAAYLENRIRQSGKAGTATP
jgi:hypothetical protein